MIEKEIFGVVNVQGKFVFPAKDDFIRLDFPDMIAVVRVYEDWGFIDMNDNYVVTPCFDKVSDCIGGFAAVKKDGKWGFIRVNFKKKFTFI